MLIVCVEREILICFYFCSLFEAAYEYSTELVQKSFSTLSNCIIMEKDISLDEEPKGKITNQERRGYKNVTKKKAHYFDVLKLTDAIFLLQTHRSLSNSLAF